MCIFERRGSHESNKEGTLALLLLVLLVDVKKNELKYIGEETNWSAEITLLQTQGKEEVSIVLKYLGTEDLSSIGQFNYDVEGPKSGFSGTAQLNKVGVYVGSGGGLNKGTTSSDSELE